MLRIVRSVDAGTTMLAVSGRIDAEQLSEFRRLVDEELTRGGVLDLAEVTLVDAQAVRFLVQCEDKGVRIAHCPAYVREWMAREKWTR
jgi:anti-anti-sigma regulatory factor